VPTADARVLPGGTAYVSDVGMVGPRESIIGIDIESVLRRFLTGLPTRLPVADDDPQVEFGSVLIEVDEETRRAKRIKRIDRVYRPDA